MSDEIKNINEKISHLIDGKKYTDAKNYIDKNKDTKDPNIFFNLMAWDAVLKNINGEKHEVERVLDRISRLPIDYKIAISVANSIGRFDNSLSLKIMSIIVEKAKEMGEEKKITGYYIQLGDMHRKTKNYKESINAYKEACKYSLICQDFEKFWECAELMNTSYRDIGKNVNLSTTTKNILENENSGIVSLCAQKAPRFLKGELFEFAARKALNEKDPKKAHNLRNEALKIYSKIIQQRHKEINLIKDQKFNSRLGKLFFLATVNSIESREPIDEILSKAGLGIYYTLRGEEPGEADIFVTKLKDFNLNIDKILLNEIFKLEEDIQDFYNVYIQLSMYFVKNKKYKKAFRIANKCRDFLFNKSYWNKYVKIEKILIKCYFYSKRKDMDSYVGEIKKRLKDAKKDRYIEEIEELLSELKENDAVQKDNSELTSSNKNVQ